MKYLVLCWVALLTVAAVAIAVAATPEVATAEVATAEVATAEVATAEVATAEVATTEVDTAVAASAEVAPATDDLPRPLVLLDGGTVVVKSAEVKGSFVHFELEDGRLQAYPIENVDLASSGLLPAPEPEVLIQNKRHAATMADATYSADTESVMSITDADVEHLGSETPGSGADGNDGRVSLPVSNLRKQVNGMLMKLTGVVENSTSAPARSIIVEAVAVGEGGDRAGSGRLTIADVVAPGDSIPFTCEIPVTSPVSQIDVTASIKAPSGSAGRRSRSNPKKPPWWQDYQLPTVPERSPEQPEKAPPE